MKPLYFATPIVLSLILVCVSFAAEDISVSASVDKKVVPLGNVITLTIHIRGSQSVGVPSLPEIDGFQSQYMGHSTQLSIVNNRSLVSLAHSYSLLALKTGRFTIPPIQVEYESKTYRTDPIGVEVVSGTDQQQSRTMTPEDLKKYIQLAIRTRKTTAYLNEGIPLLIRLYIRSGVSVRNVRYPIFPSSGFSVLPFSEPIQRQTTMEGVLFRTIDFQTTVYPVTCGELVLGPAELNCVLMATSSRSQDFFFDRRARYHLTVKSDPHTITVKPLPAVGQPESFSGAVGQYDFDVVAKPTSLKAGEPVTLTMTVKGQGNIDLVNVPKIAGLTQFKAYDPQTKEGNAREKTFEQVLIPISDNVEAIPEIQFSYFDPEAERYITRTRGPIPIQVAPSDEAEPLQILEITGGKAVKREVLGRDIVYIKDDMGSIRRGDGGLYKSKGFLMLQLLPLIGFVGTLVYQRRRDRFAADRTYARQYHAPKKAKRGLAQAQKLMASGQPQEFCSTIFKTMQEYLGDRFDFPFAGITIEIVDSLHSQGVSEEILEKLTAFFQACDRIRFAQSDTSEHEMNAIMNLATESIKLLESIRK